MTTRQQQSDHMQGYSTFCRRISDKISPLLAISVFYHIITVPHSHILCYVPLSLSYHPRSIATTQVHTQSLEVGINVLRFNVVLCELVQELVLVLGTTE